MAKFNERFKELVETSGLEKTYIYGTLLNISRFQFYNWCNGRGEPDTEALKQIAKIFNVSLEWLLGASSVRLPTEYPDKDLPAEAIKQLDEYRELLRMKYLGSKK